MTTFNVPDMSCGHCVATIEKAVKTADAGAVLTFDLEARKVEITSALDDETLAKTLEAEGYPSTVAA